MTPVRSLACQQLVELVTAYLDDALSDSNRRRVEEHIAACGDCAAYLAQIRTVIALASKTVVDPVVDRGSRADPVLPPAMLDDLLRQFRLTHRAD